MASNTLKEHTLRPGHRLIAGLRKAAAWAVLYGLALILGSCLNDNAEGVPPLTPTGLTATYDSAQGIVRLSWKTLSTADLAGYILYSEAGSGSSLNSMALDTIFQDTVYNDTLYSNPMKSGDSIVTYRLKGIDVDANPSIGYSKAITVSALSPRHYRERQGDTAFFPADRAFLSAQFWTPDTGVAGTGDGVLYKTQDGGRTWQTWAIPAPGSDNLFELRAIRIKDATTAFVAARAGLYRTTNSGATWLNWSLGSSNDANDIAMPAGDTVYAVGEYIYRSTNGGTTWQTKTFSGYDTRFQSISCPTSSLCYAAGSDWGKTGITLIAKTTDGGANWTLTTDTTRYDIVMDCPNVSTCYQSTWNETKKTSDGGATWTRVLPYGLVKIDFLDKDFGYALRRGEIGDYGAAGNALLKTTDGGSTWTSQSPLGRGAHFYAIAFPTKQVGYAFGDGYAVKTTDGGITWRPL